MKKILFLTILLVAASLTLVPFVSATTYTFGSTTYALSHMDAGVANYAGAVELIPISGTDSTFGNVTLYAFINTNGGWAKGVIWNGSSAAVIEICDTAQLGLGWMSFAFDITLLNNTAYYFGVVFSAAGAGIYYDGSYAQVGHGFYTTNSYASPTNLATSHNGFMAAYIVCDDGVSPTPTPPPGYGDETIDTFINEFTDFMVPLIVMLVPSVLMGYSFKMGKWGYLIGLAIGSGLGVIFITGFPLWLVFAVFVGLIGFAYSEARRGG